MVATMPNKLGGNRAWGRVFARATHAFSAGIKSRYCSHSWYDYTGIVIGFKLDKNLKMTLYSHSNPISHLKSTSYF